MINPAQFNAVLSKANDSQLMAMLKRPDKIPTQFVVAEINKRQAMRRNAKAQQQTMAQRMPVAAPPMPQASQQMAPMGRQQPQPQQQPQRMYEGGVPLPRPTIGIRNNNPLNLRPLSGDAFFGTTGVNKGYSTFSDAVAGLRAGAVNMDSQVSLHGIDNIDDYIDKFAPEEDNSPEANFNYKRHVAKALNVGIDDKVDFTKPDVKKRLLKAQVVFENGSNPYPDELYDQAVAMSMDKSNNPFDVTRRKVSTVSSPTSQPATSTRAPIYDTIDDLVAKNDRASLQALATDKSVPSTYGIDAQRYAQNALGRMTASNNPYSPPVRSSSGAGPSDAMFEKYGDSIDNMGFVAGKPPLSPAQKANQDRASRISKMVGAAVTDNMPRFGAGPSDAMYQKYGDSIDNMGTVPLPANRRFGAGPSDAMFEKYGDSMDNMGFVTGGPRPNNTTSAPPDDGTRTTEDNRSIGQQRRDSRHGTGPKNTSIVDMITDFFTPDKTANTSGRNRGRGGNRNQVDDTTLDNTTSAPPDDGTRTGITSLADAAGPLSEGQSNVGFDTLSGGVAAADTSKFISDQNVADAVGGAITKTGKNDGSGLGALNIGQIDLPYFDTDLIKDMKEDNAKLLKEYNEGTADLIKRRTELLEMMDSQRRTPQNMLFSALIDFGLALASSPESNFMTALAQAGQQGISSFRNLAKQDQEQLFARYKMAYDIASTEFDHKMKGRKLALDLNTSLLNTADKISQMNLRGAQAKYYESGGRRTDKSNIDAATYRQVLKSGMDRLADPMSAVDFAVANGLMTAADRDDGAQVTPQMMSVLRKLVEQEALRQGQIAAGRGITGADSQEKVLPGSSLIN